MTIWRQIFIKQPKEILKATQEVEYFGGDDIFGAKVIIAVGLGILELGIQRILASF